MLPNVMRGISFASLAAGAACLGACAADKSAPAVTSWSYPGEQPAAAPRPLMRLAALPMNPPPEGSYADYTQEPTRFLFQPRIVILDDGAYADESTETGGDYYAQDTGEGGM